MRMCVCVLTYSVGVFMSVSFLPGVVLCLYLCVVCRCVYMYVCVHACVYGLVVFVFLEDSCTNS